MKLVENKFSIWYINNVRYVNKNEIEKKITISSNGKIEKSIDELPKDLKYEILDVFSNIDNANEKEELQKIITKRYTVPNEEVNPKNAHPRKGIKYSAPKSRISSYQSLNEAQLLEVNKIYAKLAVLENENILEHVIPHSSNSKLRETIGNAF